jgi:hypothetical protein
MATTQAADVSYISKVIYKDGIQQKQIVRDKPLLLATKHNTKFTSAEGIKVPILYGTGQGASATVANAATNASPDAGAAFTVTQATYYTNFDIHGKVVRNALKGNDDSFFLQQLKLAMDNAQETMGSELNRQAYGTSAGWRARVGAVAPSGTTAVLANPQDAVFFEPNMVVVFAATPTGAIRAGTPGWAKILKVDTQTGTLTFDGTITVLITTPGAGDYIFRQGDAQTDAVIAIAGFDQLLGRGVTLAADLLSDLQVGHSTLHLPETVHFDTPFQRQVDPTNIPDIRDDLVSGAFGVKYVPKDDVTLIANLLVPLNRGGVRSRASLTFGAEYTF